MKKIILVLISILSFNAFADVRPAKTPSSAGLDKIIFEAKKRTDNNGAPTTISATSYAFYDHDNVSLETVIKNMAIKECWGECGASIKVKMKTLDSLKLYPELEDAAEVLGSKFLVQLKAYMASYGKKSNVLYFKTNNDAGSTYWSEILYIAIVNADDGQSFEIYKIEYLEGK